MKINAALRFVLLLTAVAFAGVASLCYEVLWVRQLGLSLGSTAVATSVMLSAFLGGLALGSTWMGRRADGLAQPTRALTLVEVIAAVLGVAAIPALGAAGHAYVFLAQALGVTGVGATVLRALFALVVMLVPATLFGMTFPLATTLGTRLLKGTVAAGAVSAVSSFGSAIGALLCGLWLEPTLGIFRSALVGAGFNVVAALCILAIWLAERKK
jgi:spermidine synthase